MKFLDSPGYNVYLLRLFKLFINQLSIINQKDNCFEKENHFNYTLFLLIVFCICSTGLLAATG